ncbi:MAG TPA: hypothetical protein VFD43_01185 [Planctomycetota bacterium]|nr:hypothetical protein [Planctomycetota bacterium]
MRHALSSVRPVVLALASLSVLVAPAAADVIVVDPAGGGDTTDLTAALANANSGDILVLAPADYTLFASFLEVDGKALTIVGAAGGTTTLPPLSVSGVPAGGTFVLRHLNFQPNSFTAFFASTVVISSSAGNVHIEDCTILGFPGQVSSTFGLTTAGKLGLRLIDNDGAVAVHRSSITGGAGAPSSFGLFTVTPPSPGAPAIYGDGGRLALFDVTATGGQGGDGVIVPSAGAPGGHGLHAKSYAVILSGTTLTGGEGGAGTAPGPSGNGASITGDGSSLSEIDSTIVGGTGSPPLLLSGPHELWPGQAWQLVLGGPVESGELGSFSVSGPPNCLFGLFLSGSMGYQPIGKFKGPFLPGVPFFGPQLIAATNGSGVFAASFVAPSLVPFGLEALLHVDQALMVQPGDGLVLSSGTTYIQYETVH